MIPAELGRLAWAALYLTWMKGGPLHALQLTIAPRSARQLPGQTDPEETAPSRVVISATP
jgi:hypothetical protein